MTPAMVKHYWTEMLHAVQVIHKVGIIHSDLKPANFLLVAGRLKLIDFGIASAVQSDKTSVIKDSQMGTFNFMSPEAIQDVATGPQYDASGTRKPCIKISIKSDVWSLGCILYNLAYGKMPFGEIRHPLMKLQAIVNPDHKINFSTEGQDPLLIDVLKSCLVRDPRGRPSICSLLQHPYVTGVKEKEGQVTTQEALSAINIVANLKLDAVLTPNTLDRTRKGLAEAMEKLGSNSELDVLRKLEL
jgi:serine/threonine-protein kinase TTK/MPS1